MSDASNLRATIDEPTPVAAVLEFGGTDVTEYTANEITAIWNEVMT